jgi:hypothetical protein
MDMLSIQLTKGCKCLKTLVCSFLLHQFPLYLKVFYRTRRASRQNIILMLILYQCIGQEGTSCDLSIFYILYQSDEGVAGVLSFIGDKVNT